MNLIKTLLPVIAAAFVCFSCGKESQHSDGQSGRVRMNLDLKMISSEEILQEGACLGLFIGEPVNENNILATVSSQGSLTTDKELFWAEGQTSSSSIVAYYPFDIDYSMDKPQSFSVYSDQSTPEALRASDFLYSMSLSRPTDPSVSIILRHVMSSVNLYFDNRTGLDIREVYLDNVCLDATIDLQNGNVSSSDKLQSVKAASLNDGKNDYFSVIIVPQKATPSVKVVLSDGTSLSYPLDREADFASKYSYSTEDNPIIIEDGADPQKALSLSFSVSDWVDGGTLNFNGEDAQGDYTSLRELAATATTSSQSFSVIFKDVTVTYSLGKSVHLEDRSGAVLLFKSSTGLKEGDVINGAVSGKIVLYSSVPEITDINLDDATIGHTTVIPQTELTIAQLNASFEKYLSMRILLKNVTVTEGIESGYDTDSRTGKIVQDGSSATIYGAYSSSPASIQKGLTGNLVCFPSIYQDVRQLNVYASSDFEQSADSGEDSPFTMITCCGVYDLSDSESPSTLFAADEYEQLNLLYDYDFISFCVMNPENGYAWLTKVSSSYFSVGSIYSLTSDTFGNNSRIRSIPKGSYSCKLVKKSSDTVWLKDEDDKIGFILSTDIL